MSTLAPGYAGLAGSEARLTLNASFFAAIAPRELGSLTLVPQRIPRADFFAEWLGAAQPEERTAFHGRVQGLVRGFSRSVAGPDSLMRLKLLLRFGAFDEVKELADAARTFDGAMQIELSYLAFQAELNRALSDDAAVDLTKLKDLALRAADDTRVPLRLKAEIGTALIVQSVRVAGNDEARSVAESLAPRVAAWVTALPDGNEATVAELALKSMLLRGLPMAAAFPMDKKKAQLDEALRLANRAVEKSVKTGDAAEIAAARENVYTLHLTLSKFSRRSSVAQAEGHLRMMVALDRYDATGWTELGILLVEQERWDEAGSAFATAIEAGPPGLAMNLYFHGRCLLATGDALGARLAFASAAEADDAAVSPRLELARLAAGRGDRKAARMYASALVDSDLRSMLEPEEETELRAMLQGGW